MSRRGLLASGLAMLAGCGGARTVRDFPFSPGDAAAQGGLRITYYTAGCFLLSWRDVALLTDPFWSHLPMLKVGLGRIASVPSMVDPYLPDLSAVSTVLVGHSHYDHVLDLPYVSPYLAPGAQVFGSTTLQHILAPLDLPLDMVPVSGFAARPAHAGRWLTAARGRIRVLPIDSGHDSHALGLTLWGEQLTADRTAPPTRAGHYPMGRTFAFLVDFLDGDTVAHRVYIQTTSRGHPDGFFPEAILQERAVDVALLPMDCAKIEAETGASIIGFLQAPTVIFCHWERFFRSREKTPWQNFGVDLAELGCHFLGGEPGCTGDPRFDYRFPAWDSHHHFPDP